MLLLVCAAVVAAAQDACLPGGQSHFPLGGRSRLGCRRSPGSARPVRARLKKQDFVVEEGGVRREMIDFRADDNAPVRVALLFDVSGSMRLASHSRTRARRRATC